MMDKSLLNGSWLSTDEVAALLRVDPSSLRRWRTMHPPKGPAFVQLSDRVTIYNSNDVEAWLRERRIDPSAAA